MELVKSARLVAFTAAIAIAAVALPAKAQEISQTHLKAARTAIEAIDATAEFDGILPDAAQRLKAELIQQNPNMENLISATVNEQALALASRRADLENEAATAYARVFSEEELNQIAEFYNSPTGQKLLSDGPIVTREVLQAAEIWRRGVVRDLANAVSRQLGAAIDTQAPEQGEQGGGQEGSQ
ncbi:DUF2059 domain-containing protein [Chelativorans sp. M5D2P16]|uniref:DUF2059 domain-containing protein n=1 Tax=Chelativorans sp. M5D2P16 TaxID=3095678 RepID=UPI002ACA5AE2|nr:DUF2059 domain-containing protein [Chelativorans sp. M5D2P16]MDZ5697768.1 DUF2059 domain-containing protein [Chelativorans sp. M5D2P16]